MDFYRRILRLYKQILIHWIFVLGFYLLLVSLKQIWDSYEMFLFCFYFFNFRLFVKIGSILCLLWYIYFFFTRVVQNYASQIPSFAAILAKSWNSTIALSYRKFKRLYYIAWDEIHIFKISLHKNRRQSQQAKFLLLQWCVISWTYNGENANRNASLQPQTHLPIRSVYQSWCVHTHILMGQHCKQFMFHCLTQGRRHGVCVQSPGDCTATWAAAVHSPIAFFWVIHWRSLTVMSSPDVPPSRRIKWTSIFVCPTLVRAGAPPLIFVSTCCPPVRTTLTFNASSTLTKNRAWLFFSPASVLALIYDIYSQLKEKRGLANGKGFINGPGSCRGEDQRGRGNTDCRTEDVFLSRAS